MHRLLITALLGIVAWPATSSAASLRVEIDPQIAGGGKPVIEASTNLPEGMLLQVSIRAAAGGYSAEADAVVASGHFHAGPFSDGTNPLNSGQYIIEITSPAADFEPPAVQAALGAGAGNLRGPLVVYDPAGLGLGRSIKDTVEVNIN